MSVEAISRALNLAPVPADRGRQLSSACKFVLVGLANHAGPDGTGAFPSVATLVRYTGLAERTVRTCLDRRLRQCTGQLARVGRHALVLHDGCMRGVGGCLLAKLVSSGVLRADEPILEASMEMAGKLASAP